MLRRATKGRIPLSISGELTRPTVSVDLTALAEGAVREEIGRRLFEALGSGDDDEAAEDGAPPPEQDPSARAQDEDDERERRRESGRQLLRGLIESNREGADPEKQESGSEAEAESEPPPD